MNKILKNTIYVLVPPFISSEGFIPRREIKKTSRFGWRLTRSERTGALIFLSCLFFSAHAIFDYDRAIMASQKGNWPEATTRLKKVLADQPDRPDILYDSGISAYKNEEFDKALAYFSKAGDTSNAPQELREQSYFNAGNAQVQLKQLKEAIESYDKVLALNPEHEKAKHNKEVVKKMLEQEKKQEEEKDKEKKEEEEKKENKQDPEDQKNQEKNQEQKDSDKKQQQNQEQQNKEQEQQKKEKSQQQEKQKKESAEQKEKQEKQRSESGQSRENGKQEKQKLSAALEHALNEREKKDAQLNKKMIKAMASESHTGGKNGNNCW